VFRRCRPRRTLAGHEPRTHSNLPPRFLRRCGALAKTGLGRETSFSSIPADTKHIAVVKTRGQVLALDGGRTHSPRNLKSDVGITKPGSPVDSSTTTLNRRSTPVRLPRVIRHRLFRINPPVCSKKVARTREASFPFDGKTRAKCEATGIPAIRSLPGSINPSPSTPSAIASSNDGQIEHSYQIVIAYLRAFDYGASVCLMKNRPITISDHHDGPGKFLFSWIAISTRFLPQVDNVSSAVNVSSVDNRVLSR